MGDAPPLSHVGLTTHGRQRLSGFIRIPWLLVTMEPDEALEVRGTRVLLGAIEG
jgi:hypothetical protein